MEAQLLELTKKLEETMIKVSNLEKELYNLKSSRKDNKITNRPVPKITQEITCNVIIYKYKNSLLLVSASKDNGTYDVKEQIKQIGAKWSIIMKEDGSKITGWLMLGILKEFSYEDSLNNIVEKLKEKNVILNYKTEEEII